MPSVDTAPEPLTTREAQSPPELTVLIHANNSSRYIGETIASILNQNNVSVDVTVVGDSSTSDTLSVLASLEDPRTKLHLKENARQANHCLDAALDSSRAPFIAQVGVGDLLLPGCLEKLLSLCRSDPRIGMVHCYSFEIDANGEITREAFRRRRTEVLRKAATQAYYLNKIVDGKHLADSIRVYRREALESILINAQERMIPPAFNIDLEISKHFDIKIVPEFLYARRNDPQLTHSRKRHSVPGLLSGIRHLANGGRLQSLERRIRYGLASILSKVAVGYFSWWPIGSSLTRSKPRSKTRKIAYYLWHFPVLSQTFVNRELMALKGCDLSVEIVAEGSENVDIADDDAKLLLQRTHYLEPIPQGMLWKYGAPFFRENPVLFINLLFFVITRRHDAHKGLKDDLHLFARVAQLARFLRQHGFDHVHAPWADKTAYTALLAARLCGITYSVQGRAHDIHRKSYLFALREKFENAEFVVTNSRYNQAYIQSLISAPHRGEVELVYNGIDLDKFLPHPKGTFSEQCRLLCVARLIEQKGFPYLLQALAILKEKGISFRCEIIGGPEQPLYTDYLIQIRKQHRKLELEDCVFFLGAQPFAVVMEKYQTADIFVLPCVIAKDGSRDITPNSLIEAMAMKLPVVSTNVTGIPEIVDDGISGLLIEPNDVDALADALERLIGNPELRTRLGEAARRRVEERFDFRRNVRRRMELFEQVLGVTKN